MKVIPYSQKNIKYWITSDGQYYAGDRLYPDDMEVTRRPDLVHDEWDGSQWVQNPAMKQAADAVAALEATKAQAISDNLPSWTEVDDAITAATTIATLKVIVRKLARVVYWLAKNKAV